MSSKIATSFDIGSNVPVDERLTLTKEQMLSINDNKMPETYMAVCKDDGLIYVYKKTNEYLADSTGKFRTDDINKKLDKTFTGEDVANKILATDENGNVVLKNDSGSSGEENAIDSISVNGSQLTPDENKNVDIEVPSIEGLAKDTDLATVAKSGSYNDLENKPTIPTVTNDLTNELKSSYDSAATAKHTHSNKDMLDKLSVNSSGVVLYNGNPIIIPTSRPTTLLNGSIWVE